eukprot:1159490-Pelagomonas_calceolata.AAC.2
MQARTWWRQLQRCSISTALGLSAQQLEGEVRASTYSPISTGYAPMRASTYSPISTGYGNALQA